jgi:hypothetical protein
VIVNQPLFSMADLIPFFLFLSIMPFPVENFLDKNLYNGISFEFQTHKSREIDFTN